MALSMKKQIVFIHGGTAFSAYDAFIEYLKRKPIDDPLDEQPKKRWKDTLRTELHDTHEVYYPAMPNSANAHYEEWKLWFERYFEFLHNGVILVGHSLGGYFLAKYLTENEMPITVHALYLCAAPFEPDDFNGEDGGDFAFDASKLGNMQKNLKNIYILHAKDDPVVPFAHAEKYAHAIPQATLWSFEDGGHFLSAEFPELVAHIRER